MVLREGAFSGVAGKHRGIDQFGQLHQLTGRLGPEDPLSGVDHRVLGRQQGLHGIGHVAGVAQAFVALHRPVIHHRLVHLFRANVAGHLHHHGAAPSGTQRRVCPSHHLGNTVGLVDLRREFGDAVVGNHSVKVRRLTQSAAGGPAGNNQDGRRLGISVGDAAKSVFYTRSRLGDHHAGAPAVGYPGIPIGHVHRRPLGAGHDGFNSGDGAGFDEGIGREAKQILGVFHFQDIGYGGVAIHAEPPSRDGSGAL